MTTSSPVQPWTRVIFAVDIEASTERNNAERAAFRDKLYELLEQALEDSGIGARYRDLVDRGDGVLVLVHPVDTVPKTTILTSVIPNLAGKLVQLAPEERFRLRVAVHAGDVHKDKRGWYGEDLDITFRFLDAPCVKRRLKETTAPLVVVVSQEIYRSVVRHGYDGIDNSTYEPIVRVRIAGQRLRGWVQVPTTLTA